MDATFKSERKRNPVEKANFLSIWMFIYMLPIFKKGFKNGMTEEDLYQPLEEHKSGLLGEKLEKVWKQEHRKHKKSALHRALFKVFGLKFMFLGLLKLIDEVMLVVVMPLSIGRLVSFFEQGQTNVSVNDAYIAASSIALCLLVDCVLVHPCMMGLMHINMKLRVACSSLVYRKTLRLSRPALASTTVGQLVNLLSNDVSKFDQGFVLAHFIWVGPIQTAIGAYLLYREIGYAAFCGMAFLLSFIPLQIYLGKRTSVLRLRTALRTDERVRLMNEVISGIQAIKMYCWEIPFGKLVALARKKEMQAIRSHAYLLGIVYSFEMFVTRTAIFVSILGYVLFGSFVTAQKVFAITAIYNVLRPVITILFSISISSIAEVNVSIIRIQTFLSYEEKEEEQTVIVNSIPNGLNGSNNESKTSLVPYSTTPKPRILVEQMSAKWAKEASENTLNDINLSVATNQVVAVVGPVGSGKSSLLNVFLKELPIESGKMDIQGQVSYSSQEPWLFSASVRQNILFGDDFDEERYEQIVDVCALRSDFELFPYGDKTLVGERGKALSGGQKARINLARCIYKKADIYLLDDPLSAVDANVGKHLYEKCIRGFLKNKICVLITHQLQYLSSADKIVIMKDGRIEIDGTFTELQSSGLNFAKLLEEFHQEEEEEKEKIRSRQSSECVEVDDADDAPVEQKELLETGSIKGGLYLEYFKSGGGKVMCFFLIATFVIGQFVSSSGDYYVSQWVNKEDALTQRILNNLSQPNETLPHDQIIYTYSGIITGTIIFAITHSMYFMLFFTFASVNLHTMGFASMIKATMRFYNNNPSGRILNRFSKDLGYIDEYIPAVIFDVIDAALQLIGAIILSAIVNPLLLLPAVVLVVIFYLMRLVYIQTSRSVRRIEGITRSPIFSHISASMHGLSTIRTFSAQKILIAELDNYQDNHSSAWFIFIASNRCFGFWVDLVCTVFIGTTILILLYFKNNIYGGDIGLIITQFIGLTGTLQWGMRQWSELENLMVSVERLLEYRHVESEPNREENAKVPKVWPSEGRIEFKDLSLRYNPQDPPVLKDLNFVVEPKEKIGIVGRTGAGKSSTITALFQLYPIEGSVVIDGVNTTKVPLDQIRSKISIIPQEPMLFSGTMRKNLDPFEEFTDETLWNALEQVELKDVIAELPSGLHSNVSEGGSNFSVGQRQLVCLARALIRNNKILVMDEATANVDPHTDGLIQNTIRTKFADCTVLTIAHRLHTVMDSDKILVMAAGTVQEYDHPYNLLKKDGILHSLVQITGKTTAAILETIARESYEKKQKTD